MLVEVLFTRRCPHQAPTLRLVRRIARQLGVEVDIRAVEVRSAADAARLRFIGSPTVRVDGRDIEPSGRDITGFGMSCRLYGRSGIPPADLVAAALAGGGRR